MVSHQGMGIRRLPMIGEAAGATPGSLQGVHRAAVTVTQLSDVVNGNTSSIANLIASDGGDGISLREAILAANNDAAADVITLGAGTHVVTGNAFFVNTQLSIEGAGKNVTIIDAAGGSTDRVFTVNNSTAFGLTDLTITGGGSSSVVGGALNIQDSNVTGLRVSFQNNTASAGGAVYFNGSSVLPNTVSFTDSEFAGNFATSQGGAIYSSGVNNSTFLLDRSLVAENRSISHGGGIWNFSTNTAMTLRNSTVSGNSAGFNQAGSLVDSSAAGGGIMANTSGGSFFLDHSTVARNVSSRSDTGGGIWNTGYLSTTNSIVADNIFQATNASGAGGFAGDILNQAGNWTRSGANVVEVFTNLGAVFGAAHITTDPGLGALADNGGPTRTHAITSASVAYNAAVGSTLTVDQRGAARPFAGVSDIGAFESGAV
ncbi:MAG: hypothetical protein KDL87_17490, partial [Verrucomicrobiae bacterium]|nr:hypothetical protein [Verrucomicrobiae bacterium]